MTRTLSSLLGPKSLNVVLHVGDCATFLNGEAFPQVKFPSRCTNHPGHTSNPNYPPPHCVSYANVHNYYGPYAYCSLDKGVACAQHIQLLTHTCGGHMC